MTPTQEKIVGRIAKLKSEIKELWTDCATLRAENERLRQDRDELRRFAYEDAPKIAAKEANDQTAALREEIKHLHQERDEWRERRDLAIVRAEEAEERTEKAEAEVERLREELGYIANAQRKSFVDDREFRIWAQNRARHALG